MSGVCRRPATRGPLREEPLAVRAPLTPDGPRSHVVRVVAGVTLVIERELLDRAVAGVEVVEFVVEVPLAPTAGARNGRYAGLIWVERVVGHGFASVFSHLNAAHAP